MMMTTTTVSGSDIDARRIRRSTTSEQPKSLTEREILLVRMITLLESWPDDSEGALLEGQETSYPSDDAFK